MPLISVVGRRSWGVRLLVFSFYLLLSLGAISMAYPFMLMVSIATTGRGDYHEFRLIPRYWTSEAALFRKYLLDMVATEHPAWRPSDEVPAAAMGTWFGRDDWFEPRDVLEAHLASVMGMPAVQRSTMAADVRAFMRSACPTEFRTPAAYFDADSVLALQPQYRAWLRTRYGDLAALNREYVENAVTWEDVPTVVETLQRQPGTSLREREWREFLTTLPPERVALFEPERYLYEYLRSQELPKDYAGHRDEAGNVLRSRVTFDELQAGALGPTLKEGFFRKLAPLRYVTVDGTKAATAWRVFLAARQADATTPLTERMPVEGGGVGLWGAFVQKECPIEALGLTRPEDHWRPFLRGRHGSLQALNAAWGSDWKEWESVTIPWAAFRYDCFLGEKQGLRLRYARHNFGMIMDFIGVHGSALRVTVIFILLTILASLTVNPLAAYAMSRFRLKEAHHILVFLLATMAFPGEVLMIPNFLQIKSFPYAQILTVGACLLGFFLLARVMGKRLPFVVSATLALGITVALAGWGVPGLLRSVGVSGSVNLMNTFWALILPGLANGYGIFLLKGFFDSLPPELYEAGLIDGASELRMFWQITLPLCKPILAVMALGAFSGAYGAFMHAFLICQDPKMWTLMVFLYEFQQMHIVPLVMASLVVAAIPTLLVFVFCQNIILRGIAIPTFK
jgi:ABC-type glycerol-3-phosphate transport system permease component